MLKRNYIKNDNIVLYETKNNKDFFYIKNVGNAIEKNDRGVSTTPDDELSYDIENILTGETSTGICEYSGMTSSFLDPATKKDALLYYATLEADFNMEISKLEKEQNSILVAFDKLNEKSENKNNKIKKIISELVSKREANKRYCEINSCQESDFMKGSNKTIDELLTFIRG